MFEIQDILVHDLMLYLLSIGFICSFTCAYAAHLHRSAGDQLFPALRDGALPLAQPKRTAGRIEIHRWLTRRVKRKEAPDDDSGECLPSFGIANLSERGGLLWGRAEHSPSVRNICRLRLSPPCFW
ncbi:MULTISPECIES: hypothetical protein [unclassified Paenibacillus]|uniref:hypothetical protein n=1 Tax=unclassified Paenibacillus TaxID=185978 RepID=UPI001C10EA5A|nr:MULTISPECIES: hypothetical protein [unclassified Paenibacillus]MBU5443243.1 hypothetical protein [Paenibacillus sp. MSJ-34]